MTYSIESEQAGL